MLDYRWEPMSVSASTPNVCARIPRSCQLACGHLERAWVGTNWFQSPCKPPMQYDARICHRSIIATTTLKPGAFSQTLCDPAGSAKSPGSQVVNLDPTDHEKETDYACYSHEEYRHASSPGGWSLRLVQCFHRVPTCTTAHANHTYVISDSTDAIPSK